MTLFDFDTMLTLAGVLIGIVFGFVCGTCHEEKNRVIVISTFGTVIVAFMGINFYAYGQSLGVLFILVVESCFGFVGPFVGVLIYRRWRKKTFYVSTGAPFWKVHPIEEMEIKKNAPKVDAKANIFYNILLGHKVEILLRLRNESKIILDQLSAKLIITDLRLEKKKETFRDLPNLLPGEEREFSIIEKIGRSFNHLVALEIWRKGIKIIEAHWELK